MINIRRGCFETNSSSVHSLSMCMKSEYDEWEKGNLYFNKNAHWDGSPKFLTKEEAIQYLNENWHYAYSEITEKDLNEDEIAEVMNDCGLYTCDEFFNDCDMETFWDTFKTPAGEEVVAFGYYGYDS